jgi:peptidylprolyl isomerase
MVTVHCITRDESGAIVESTHGNGALEFRLGAGQVIRALEDAVLGMEPGQTKTAAFRTEEAFGPHQPHLVHRIHRSRLPDQVSPMVGQELEIHYPDGRARPARITGISQAIVTLDGNHPLAGKNLTCDVELVSVRSRAASNS